ncbi:hypothetical protein IV41_GL000593 [Limosilactobacillus ingluviei]|uniref:Nitroreductase domain-containing protein n=1 Tax=Limosilactobacillus ingluviei TaxID=148604 RepID=A0A0R2GTN6_9LACO|nr:hypothetical protein IV41_GL000593 [Limosilactobacillus ingluviei]
MIDTHTTEVIANHRSIRAFKAQTLAKEQLTTLYKMASQTSTSMFMQQFSILHVTDPAKRAAVRAVSGQRYVGANGERGLVYFYRGLVPQPADSPATWL